MRAQKKRMVRGDGGRTSSVKAQFRRPVNPGKPTKT